VAEVPTAEQLLQDIAWLKSLATRLANDRDDADDLVQEAWIAAWRRQPDPTRPMRGWLTKVVRDVAGMKRRSDRRRAARHAFTEDARAQAPATPDELVAQLQLHKRLVELVIELEEPYRSTIIARFVEGRTSASIAQSLGIPAGTVRKRLHEALSRLRAGLDTDAGDRKRWAPAVLAFANGGIQVAKPTKLVLVVIGALLLATAATLMIVLPTRDGGAGTTASTRSPNTTSSSNTRPAAPPGVTTSASDAQTSLQPISEHRAAERAAMLAAIARAREARDHGTVVSTRTPGTRNTPTATNTDSTATTLDIIDKTGDTSDWSKRALATLNKLLGQCYDLGRAEDANLDGTITIHFRIVGEPNVGGLLERVEIVDKETTITQQTIRDCLTEQLYALELDPPPDGVSIDRQLHLKVP
jgi:RNA polymerase sigma-70 factor (ECF subfamily)